MLIDNYHGEKIDWDSLFAKKDSYIKLQKSGKIIDSCEGCMYLEKRIWNGKHYINTINIKGLQKFI